MTRERYLEDSEIEGPQQIDLRVTAPWCGHNHTISILLAEIPEDPAPITIYKRIIRKDGTDAYNAICAEIDPTQCEDKQIWFMTQVGLMAGESMGIAYSNPDELKVKFQVILEGA